MINVVAHNSAYLALMRPRPEVAEGLTAPGAFDAFAAAVDASAAGACVCYNRAPVAMFGALRDGLPHRGIFWMIFDRSADQIPTVGALRAGRRWFAAQPFTELRSWILPESARDQRFAAWFGFKYDCTATGFGWQGRDMQLWLWRKGNG